MTKLRGIRYSLILLKIINFIAILFSSSLYLHATNYIIAKGQGYQLLEQLREIPSSPAQNFWISILLFGGVLLITFYRMRPGTQEWSVFDKWNILEILLMLGVMMSLSFSYNGIILLVFADIFYGSKEFSSSKDRRYWFAFILLSFIVLLVTNYDILSLVVQLPSLDAYIAFYPSSIRMLILFAKNALASLNMVVFIISLLFYILSVVAEHHRIEKELAMVSQVNTELNSYMALSEKIAEDRERKRIAREIHDTLGHALTGISAGIDAVGVLIDIDPGRAKTQLQSVSTVVRDGIKDVRGSLNKLRPGALEDHTLRDAVLKLVHEYQVISHLQVDLTYDWDEVDLDVMVEDTVFRVIQESMTNSVRHGHASHMQISFLVEDAYIMILQDNGVGFDHLQVGYGLKQMRERVSILGGRIEFANRNGFYTRIELPKEKGGNLL